MCGITGYYSFTEKGRTKLEVIDSSLDSLHHRGPDGKGIFRNSEVALGHARLSIIDVSNAASQPFFSPDKNFVLIFNGEIFNFPELKQELLKQGVEFVSTSDTEVLLHLYIKEGKSCLQKLNGFFAFVIYNTFEDEVFIARDRYGEKPLLVHQTADGLAFASEMKAIFPFLNKKQLNKVSAEVYTHLNYVPSPDTILADVDKLPPGSWLKCSKKEVSKGIWYTTGDKTGKNPQNLNYNEACIKLVDLMDGAVKRRMISDVPLGAFLSGGIDSSVVVALASQHTDKLLTYSIGYADEPMFDETKYAKLVADRFKTEHTVFSLKNQDLFDHLFELLDSLDEPFADSSALAVYILCKETRKHVTVALSGDGADELFGGYRKHQAEWRMRTGGTAAELVKMLQPLWKAMPASRNSKLGDIVRKLRKFSQGASLSERERYWQWCGYSDEDYLDKLWLQRVSNDEYQKKVKQYTADIGKTGDINEMLLNDMNMVLPGDMLIKVDLMSMANSLEVRPPFLDVNVVDFAFRLPADYKVNGKGRKRIVQDAFRSMLPEELYNRPKQGFEVPLLHWFRNDLDSLIFGDLLSLSSIKEQNLFAIEEIKALRIQLHSNSPGDSVARIWALIVFQWWWRKWMK
ncbi:MAG: asparagine synthase (glutamine-hydrolyzing) [Bacteroidia bacterium]